MNKITDYAKLLTKFFSIYLLIERGVSHNTIRSYSNTFSLLLTFMEEVKNIEADRLTLNHFNRTAILDFLDWLQTEKQNSNATRNSRLAAIHSFSRYLQYEDTVRIAAWQEILSIRAKRQERNSFSHLSIDGIKFLLEQIPISTKEGHRNLAMLSLLYDSGARAQELINLTPFDLFLNKPYHVILFGKGQKKRVVPLQENQIKLLVAYMQERRLDDVANNRRPLFSNNRGGKLTNSGLTYIIRQYASIARVLRPELIPEKISPHTFRHSKAMHLLQAGVNLVYIRDILGHVSIQTTEIYARADSKQKREALEKAYVDVIPINPENTRWERDSNLKTWLKNFNK